jgi:hypothetical protein
MPAELLLTAVLSDQAPPCVDPAQWLEALGLAEFLPELTADTAELLALVPRADLFVQDEAQTAPHPTLDRMWGRKGRGGRCRTEVSAWNRKLHDFGPLDWRV